MKSFVFMGTKPVLVNKTIKFLSLTACHFKPLINSGKLCNIGKLSMPTVYYLWKSCTATQYCISNKSGKKSQNCRTALPLITNFLTFQTMLLQTFLTFSFSDTTIYENRSLVPIHALGSAFTDKCNSP